jgi:hypothetical protein
MTPDPTPNDDTTGFPGVLRTWRGVYTFVLVVFAVFIVLLIVLTRAYS